MSTPANTTIFKQSTPKSTPRKFEFIAGTPNDRWLFKLNRDADLSQCSPPHTMKHDSPICFSPPSPILMPPTPNLSQYKAPHDQSASESDSFLWKDASSDLLSFLANEQLCSTMLEDEEPPNPIEAANVPELSMDWTSIKDLNDEEDEKLFEGIDVLQTDCSMNEMLINVSQSQFNDTIEAMDFYIEKGSRYLRSKLNRY